MTKSKSYEWQSVGFIAHERSIGWIASLLAAVALAAGVVLVLSRMVVGTYDPWSPLVIIFFGVIVVAASLRKPDQVDYSISATDIVRDESTVSIADFSGYSIVQIGELFEVSLISVSRVKFPTSVYCSSKDIGHIVAHLEHSLPLVDVPHNWFEQLLVRLRLH